MKQGEAFRRLFAGMRADLHDYHDLRALLEAQFEAALHHRSTEICDIGERITVLARMIERRREERVKLARRLVREPGSAPMSAIADRLQGVPRAAFETCWRSLEAIVGECKALNLRNCRLLMDQHEIMQRVLNAEQDTYAPT